MAHVYSTYEAKAKLSELLRQVRAGRRVVISHRGEPVAELRPLDTPGTVEESLKRLEETGALSRARTAPRGLRPLTRRRGALGRFLASRE